MRRTKIVCTIGPTCRDPLILARMIDAGMDVARINMSHGTREQHAEVVADLRRVAQEKGKHLAILQDLCGPKIRLGTLKQELRLEVGDVVRLTEAEVEGEGNLLPVQYPHLLEETEVGDDISLADGLINLRVTGKSDTELTAVAESAGTVSSRKGVHLPNGGRKLAVLSAKDEADLRWGLKIGVDWVALSFVRAASDADRPREIMREEGIDVALLAKIERRQAVDAIDSILETFDGLMVARGDLGVEVPFEDVPSIQKMLIRRANEKARPVITATQMLLSMVTSPRPTRAEVTDVSTAITDGTDAVMLSEETANGQHPVLAVLTMARIAHKTDSQPRNPADIPYLKPEERMDVADAIAKASCKVAYLVRARVIVTPTTSGATARLIASVRPGVPILALSPHPEAVRRMALYWGVTPMLTKAIATADELFDISRKGVVEAGFGKAGDHFIITAGVPINIAGTTSLLQVMQV